MYLRLELQNTEQKLTNLKKLNNSCRLSPLIMDKTSNTENHHRYSQLQYTKNNPDLTSMKTLATTAEYTFFLRTFETFLG